MRVRGILDLIFTCSSTANRDVNTTMITPMQYGIQVILHLHDHIMHHNSNKCQWCLAVWISLRLLLAQESSKGFENQQHIHLIANYNWNQYYNEIHCSTVQLWEKIQVIVYNTLTIHQTKAQRHMIKPQPNLIIVKLRLIFLKNAQSAYLLLPWSQHRSGC